MLFTVACGVNLLDSAFPLNSFYLTILPLHTSSIYCLKGLLMRILCKCCTNKFLDPNGSDDSLKSLYQANGSNEHIPYQKVADFEMILHISKYNRGPYKGAFQNTNNFNHYV